MEAAPGRAGVKPPRLLHISAHVGGSMQPLCTVICGIEDQSNQGVAVLQLAKLLQWDQLHSSSPCRFSSTSAQLIRVLAGVQKIRGPALLDSGLPLRARLRQNLGESSSASLGGCRAGSFAQQPNICKSEAARSSSWEVEPKGPCDTLTPHVTGSADHFL